ncbi:MAG: hypothetical protein JO250_14485 [Armatimonadetes bacterium]|nr:hypothetical protein [Armatimonadota bacterium]
MKRTILALCGCVSLCPVRLAAENITYPADAGVVNITQAPYNVVPDGKTDVTAAIQRAINDNTGKRTLIYFPNGTYLISATLTIPLTDAQGHTQYGFTNLQGQSRDGVILRLRDHTFTDPARPQPVLTSGRHGSADWFNNAESHFTVDTGRGNAGAIGLQFFSNNEGCLRDVTIRSQDGAGVCGLDLAYNDMNGPLLVKNVAVRGFDFGIRTGHTVNSQTLEHVQVQGQGVAGFLNDGQCIAVRDLVSVNAVPAVVNRGKLLALIDSTLTGTGMASALPAVSNAGGLFARDIDTSGYKRAIDTTDGGQAGVTGPRVAEFVSQPVVSLFPSPPRSLGLPVRETPDVPWDDPKTWDGPTRHGAKHDDPDISAALQAAIDSGATTVYIPAGDWRIGHTVHIRGNVRRLIGLDPYLIPVDPVNSLDAPLFQFDGGRQKTVVMEGLDFGFGNKRVYAFQDNSPQTVVLKDLLGWEYRNRPNAGPLFLEDVVGGPFHFDRQTVWARQLNQESEGTHVSNAGGQLWILGYKTERGGTLIDTEGGGQTELLGGLCYTTTAGKLAPMFVNADSSVSATMGEVCYDGDPYATILRETRGGVTQTLPASDPGYAGQRLVLYAGCRKK